MEESAEAIACLLDRQSIYDCLVRYTRGIDRWDRELILSAYHPDAVDDHGQFVGEPEAFADWAIAMHRETHVSHQHALLQHYCDLDGDVAHTETYYHFVSLNRQGPPWSMIAGRYIDRFEKRETRWAIAQRVVVRDWMASEERMSREDLVSVVAGQELSPESIEFVRTGPAPTRDKRDPSYARPLMVAPERRRNFQKMSAS